MRVAMVMAAFAALVVGLDAYEEAGDLRVAQTGPLPTSVVNPRLGAPPPGGHLGETVRPPAAVAPDPDRVGNPAGAAADRLGVPPTGAVSGAPPAGGVVPRPPANAVPPPPGNAVPPPAAGAMPPAGR